jgi:hypothetical protein
MGGGSCINRRGNGAISVTLHKEYYERKFISGNICSWAFIFHVLVLFTLIVLPFVLTFTAGAFWLKVETYQEHPKVTFKHKAYGQFVFGEGTAGSKTYTYSSQKTIRDMAAAGDNLLSPPVIKSTVEDFDRDHLGDRWNISMRVRKPSAGADLRQATIVLGFDYETSDVVKMQMESLAVVSIDGLNSGGSTSVKRVKTIGTLELRQSSPIKTSKIPRQVYNDNLFSYLEYEPLDTFLSERYYGISRNETTIYNYET